MFAMSMRPPQLSSASKTPAGAGSAAGGGAGGLTLREKLKRKMQAALNKQYKADKRAEREKQDKIQQERWDRAEELRGMALRLRQREREKRHKERDDYDYDPDGSRDGHDGYSSRSGSRSRSPSRSPEPRPPGDSSYAPPIEYSRNPTYYSRRSHVVSPAAAPAGKGFYRRAGVTFRAHSGACRHRLSSLGVNLPRVTDLAVQ
ncbi:hypothetical protein HPB52_014262 [Rhipicephalus sanguineus]|uniref:CLK4-associating serine/arginine rich protein n=1 Tax=Rhipicephalus sanguineus TaxID=34632 RepID=A0A9D4T633_RHISA|nr:hypothetical protein HPB52_014262 [Rhipicephalus sanguineus]